MARRSDKNRLLASKVSFNEETGKIRIALVIEADSGSVSQRADNYTVIDLDQTSRTNLGGAWPVKAKVRLIVKMISRLGSGEFQALGRELAISNLRKKRTVIV